MVILNNNLQSASTPTCHSCKKLGLLSKINLSKNKGDYRRKVNLVAESKEDSAYEGYTMFHLSNGKRDYPLCKILFKVQGQLVISKIDSGVPFFSNACKTV